MNINGPQFSAEWGILSQAAEFACFFVISTFSRNYAEFGTGYYIFFIFYIAENKLLMVVVMIRGQMRHILFGFRWP